MGKYKKRGDSSAPPHGKPQRSGDGPALAANPKRKAQLFRFPATPDASRPPRPHSCTSSTPRTEKWSPPAFQGHRASRAGILSRYITGPRALLLHPVPGTGRRTCSPGTPLGEVEAGSCTWSTPEKEGGNDSREASVRDAGAQGVMSRPGEEQGGSRRPAAGPGGSDTSPPRPPSGRGPTGRPLPHGALPSPASPSPAPAERRADRRRKASATAIGPLPPRYLVRHGDGGFTQGLRTAAASGRQNLAPGFTNPSLFPTAQHRGWRDFRYVSRHFRYASREGGRKGAAGKRGERGGAEVLRRPSLPAVPTGSSAPSRPGPVASVRASPPAEMSRPPASVFGD